MAADIAKNTRRQKNVNEPARKPDVSELVGVAVNSSGLQFRSNVERPIDRIAALGASTLAVRLGADRQDLPIGARRGAEIDFRDALHGELAAEVIHLYVGDQLERLPVAIALFARWIADRSLFAQYAGDEHATTRRAFSERAIHEWLSNRCIACGGSGKQQRSRSGQWIKPQGSMQRNATFRVCSVCNGCRRAPSSPPQRMKALGLTREQYDSDRWDQRFSAAMTWLGGLIPRRLTRVLTAELERRKRHR
jgi:hypothetical protein